MPLFKPLGDQALQITFSSVPGEEVSQAIRLWIKVLNAQSHLALKECVAGYTTLTIYYDPMIHSYAELVQQVKQLEPKQENTSASPPTIHELPTIYGGKYGPDLADVAAYHQLSVAEVIAIHSAPTYLIYMLGFTPGFPYLGGMSSRIATPRLANPRALVPAGSVGIADQQTGIYSVDSPGGWRIIGHTPFALYQPDQEQPFPLQSGEYIRFVPISEEEYLERLFEKGE